MILFVDYRWFWSFVGIDDFGGFLVGCCDVWDFVGVGRRLCFRLIVCLLLAGCGWIRRLWVLGWFG